MYSAHVLREKRGIPVVCVIEKVSQNLSIGCLLALYGSTVHPRCIVLFFGQFFLLSVHASLKKKEKKISLYYNHGPTRIKLK